MGAMTTEDRVQKYLCLAKKLALAVVSRQNVLSDLCPSVVPDEEQKQERLQKLATVNEDIKAAVWLIKALEESGDPPIGASALIEKNRITPAIRIAIALMVLSRLSGRCAGEIRTIVHLCDVIGGSDPSAGLEVRDSFGVSGALRELVHVTLEATLDDSPIDLMETAFQRAIGREPDAECRALSLGGPAVWHQRRFSR